VDEMLEGFYRAVSGVTDLAHIDQAESVGGRHDDESAERGSNVLATSHQVLVARDEALPSHLTNGIKQSLDHSDRPRCSVYWEF
jgi:hypothetical protein